MPTIEEELAYLAQKMLDHPKRCTAVIEAIREGRIDPEYYVEEGGECGCFYGHYTGLKSDSVAQMFCYEVREHFLQDSGLSPEEIDMAKYEAYTPIELLIEVCNVGDTQHDREALADLYQALEPYCELVEG